MGTRDREAVRRARATFLPHLRRAGGSGSRTGRGRVRGARPRLRPREIAAERRGRAQRRHKKWGAARASLEDAAAFDALGSPGWADEARSEPARVAGRRGQAASGLTPTERHVAELAAEGLSNKEIARALFVTVGTVEVHLSHAYAKLGVRSRAQLARRLTAPT